MQVVLSVIYLLVCLLLIGLILVQHGKGAEVGAAFGTGASQTLFGAQGSGNFLTRLTAVMATLFFLISMALSYLALTDQRAASHALIPQKTIEKNTTPAEEPAVPPLIR